MSTQFASQENKYEIYVTQLSEPKTVLEAPVKK